jgi:hypothetical protein
MFELFLASDAARRGVQRSLEPKPVRRVESVRQEPRKTRVRSTSAAALRSLADRLETSRA